MWMNVDPKESAETAVSMYLAGLGIWSGMLVWMMNGFEHDSDVIVNNWLKAVGAMPLQRRHAPPPQPPTAEHE